jgi:hypothetical protein
VKLHKKREAQRLIRKGSRISKKLPWNEAVTVLTVSLTQAIWQEGGERDDAIATAEIVYFALCRDLNARFDLKDRGKPINVIPIKRKRSYLHGR